MAKDKIIKELREDFTEREFDRLKDRYRNIRDTAWGLANSMESFYKDYELNTYKEIIQYLQHRKKEIK